MPEEAVPLETIPIGPSGAFTHGFVLRSSWTGTDGTWALKPNDFYRIYATAGAERCPAGEPAFVQAFALPAHNGAPSTANWGSCASKWPDRGPFKPYDGAVSNFWAPAEARVGVPVHVVLRLMLANSCTVPCPESCRAIVDDERRTVTLEAATYREEPKACLESGAFTDLEVAFVPGRTGAYVVKTPLWPVPGAGSIDHLVFSSPEPDTGYQEASLEVSVR